MYSGSFHAIFEEAVQREITYYSNSSDGRNLYRVVVRAGVSEGRCSSTHSWYDGSSDRSFMVDPLSYFSFQPVLHDWCNKDRGMCYPICGMMHIKKPLLLIGKSSPCGGSGFALSQTI